MCGGGGAGGGGGGDCCRDVVILMSVCCFGEADKDVSVQLNDNILNEHGELQ